MIKFRVLGIIIFALAILYGKPFSFVNNANAVDARKCITVFDNGETLSVRNSCSSFVLFAYCVSRPCTGNGVNSYYESRLIFNGNEEREAYKRDGNDITWAACTLPDRGNVWIHITSTDNNGGYTCSNHGQ